MLGAGRFEISQEYLTHNLRTSHTHRSQQRQKTTPFFDGMG
jgi:hypothetical protein